MTLSPSSKNVNTSKVEFPIQRRLLQLHKNDLLLTTLYELFRPTDSQGPRMYGLPKTNKKDGPLRPILSTTESAQRQLAKYLTSLLEPVLTLHSSNCISDSFTFGEITKTSKLNPSSEFLFFCCCCLTFRVYLVMSLERKLFKSALTPSTIRNTFLHLFLGKSLLNLFRWLLLLSSSASMTSYIARSTESPWDHPLHQLLSIFSLANKLQ